MTEAFVRPAHAGDIDDLVRMRADFTFEHFDGTLPTNPGYEDECRAFLEDAIAGGRWQIWVAELEGSVVSHAFVALVDKVPRPIYVPRRIAYLTNVYTRPEHRNHGIGAAVIRRAQEAARDADVELMVVWPSDESRDFYAREGFERPDDPLVWHATRQP
jgi:GNAT superfamily N-acetyltransferase